ncbi:hypothetical protein CBL_20918 [Carabus blaptoides fortunei]
MGIDFIKEAKLVLDPGNMSWSFADRPSQTYPFANHYPVTANVMEVVADTRAYELRSSEGADLSSDQRKQLNALLVKYHHNFKRGGEVTPSLNIPLIRDSTHRLLFCLINSLARRKLNCELN